MKPSKKILNAIRRIQIAQMKLYENDNHKISISIACYYYSDIIDRDWYVYIHNKDNEDFRIWHFHEGLSKEEIENAFNEMYDFIGFVF